MKGGEVVVKQSETAAEVSFETPSSKVSHDVDAMEEDTEPFQQKYFAVVVDRMDEDPLLDTRLDSHPVHGTASGSANMGLHPTAMDYDGHDHSSNHSFFGVNSPLPPVTLPSNALLQMSPIDVSVTPETPSASKAPSLDAFKGEAMFLSTSSYANIDLGDGHSDRDGAVTKNTWKISKSVSLQSPFNAVKSSENATPVSPRSSVDREELDIEIITESDVRRASEQAPARSLSTTTRRHRRTVRIWFLQTLTIRSMRREARRNRRSRMKKEKRRYSLTPLNLNLYLLSNLLGHVHLNRRALSKHSL